MREWNGLKVPIEPEKSWKWMKECFEYCKEGHREEIPCTGTNCEDCIYSRLHADARASFYAENFEQEEKMFEWNGLKVPVYPKKEWAAWMCSKDGCPGSGSRMKCIDVCVCANCIYSRCHWEERRCFYEQYYGKWNQAPKLTAEVFNRPDCPDWAQYAVLDKRGMAYYTRYKPVAAKDDVALDWLVDGSYRKMSEEYFDASDWQDSLIERPAKELPKLTQTAFHCPDCPKEAATLKVFPANRVVALDKDDKVLSVMELRCQEGEVKKSEWLFSKAYNRIYRIDDYRQDIPEDAEPVHVQYFTPEELIGLAVKKHKTAKNYLIAAVDGLTVTLLGIEGKELLSMPTLVQFYSFTANRQPCCIIDFPQ